ncbi:MAG TPA: hypothetical protein VFM71_13975 [Gemmatimonadaceae bacterium]|nr:hypothetical protein [Gemmatimonadaceae bacterium]
MSYVGEWALIPELSLYTSGVPPISGHYNIARVGEDQLALEVVWRMPGDTADKSTRFGGRADGSRVALPASEHGPDAYSLTHVDERTLDSAAYRGTVRLAYARRIASDDGMLLAVVQEALAPDGTPVRNFQLYRRAAR